MLVFNNSQLKYLEQATTEAQPFWCRVNSIITWSGDQEVEQEALLRAHIIYRTQTFGDSDVPLDLRVMIARLRKEIIKAERKPAFVLTRISEERGPPAASVRRLIDHYNHSGFRGAWLNSHNEAVTFLLLNRNQFPAIIPQEALAKYLESIMMQTAREQIGEALCRCSLRLSAEPCAVCGYKGVR